MRHLEEGEIHAWLDGAVDSEAAGRIEAHVATCEQCAAEVATARGLIAGASRILLALDGVPAGVIPAARQAVRPRSPWFARPLTRLAAGLVVAVGIGALATRDRSSEPGAATVAFETEAAKMSAAPGPQTPVVERAAAAATVTPPPPRIEKITEAPGAPAPAPSALRKPVARAALPPVKAVVGGAGGGQVGTAVGAAVAVRARDSSSPAQRAEEGFRRLESVTRAVPAAAESRVTVTDLAAGATAAGGACLALDVSPSAGSTAMPLLPRRMRIRLAESPSAVMEMAPTRSLSNASAQGAGVGMRRSAAPAADAFGASATEPSAASWQTIAGDSVVARLVAPGGLVVFRLQIIGDAVKGTAGPETSPAQAAMVSGRRVACGGGL